MPETFTAEVTLHGRTATFITVPAEVVMALSDRRRVPVRVTIDGDHTYRSTVAPMGGEFLLPLNRKNREAAGVAAGKRVDVTVELDTEPRVVEPPPELAAALAAARDAAETFDGMSYSHQREYAEWVAEAKREETRRRRAAKTVEMLREGRTRS